MANAGIKRNRRSGTVEEDILHTSERSPQSSTRRLVSRCDVKNCLSYEVMYEGESNENRKNFFKFNLLNESGTQLYNFST
jgi:CRISPR/Cas system CMR subunit Cmr4 (Cas7 group RAMP superfamily)